MKATWRREIAFCAVMDLEQCLADMPGIIRRHNISICIPNTDKDGYHETITLFYLTAIDHFTGQLSPASDYVDGLNRLIPGPY